MKKEKISVKKSLPIIFALVFGIALTGGLVLAYEGVYQTLWYPLVSWEAPYMMTYEPFSGKLFDLEEIKIAKAAVIVVTNFHLDHNGTEEFDTYYSEVDAEEIAKLLNDFRYYAWGIHPRCSNIVPSSEPSLTSNGGGIYLSGRGKISMSYTHNQVNIEFFRYPRGDEKGKQKSRRYTIEYFCAPWEIAKLDNFCREACGIGPDT